MKKIGINLLLGIVFLGLSTRVVAAADPRLTLSPTSGTYNVGDNFTVTVGIDSASQVVGAVDIIGTFDVDKLELVSFVQSSDMVFNSGTTTGGSCSKDDSGLATGKFSAMCYGNMTAGDTVVKGNLMVFTFKAKATGTANVKFTCNGQVGDCNLTQSTTYKDVGVCSAYDNGVYTIVSSGAATSTPTPTTAATTTTTTTKTTELPKTGGVASTFGLIVFGAISLASALFLKFL